MKIKFNKNAVRYAEFIESDTGITKETRVAYIEGRATNAAIKRAVPEGCKFMESFVEVKEYDVDDAKLMKFCEDCASAT